MIASRIHIVSLLLCLSAAPTGIAAEPAPPATADGTAPQKVAGVLDPVTNPDDPLSPDMSAAETARVDEIAAEVRRLWQQNPHMPLPADSKTPVHTWVRRLD